MVPEWLWAECRCEKIFARCSQSGRVAVWPVNRITKEAV